MFDRSMNRRPDMQDKVDEVYKNQKEWTKRSILSTAGTAFFSSDRTIQDYVDNIWHCEPCPVPLPTFSGGESP
jgi:starch phosphorylase